MKKLNEYIYQGSDLVVRFLTHAWVAWIVMLVVSGIYYFMMDESLSRPLFYGLIIIIAISSLLSTIKSAQKIYIWLDLAYQLFLQFCVAWIAVMVVNFFVKSITETHLSKPLFYIIVAAIMVLLFLQIWRKYPRHINNLFLTFIIAYETIVIPWNAQIFFRITLALGYDFNTREEIVPYISFWLDLLPLASYITAYTSKKWFYIIFAFSVIVSMVAYFI